MRALISAPVASVLASSTTITSASREGGTLAYVSSTSLPMLPASFSAGMTTVTRIKCPYPTGKPRPHLLNGSAAGRLPVFPTVFQPSKCARAVARVARLGRPLTRHDRLTVAVAKQKSQAAEQANRRDTAPHNPRLLEIDVLRDGVVAAAELVEAVAPDPIALVEG